MVREVVVGDDDDDAKMSVDLNEDVYSSIELNAVSPGRIPDWGVHDIHSCMH